MSATLYRPQDHTADEWRALAQAERDERARSFADSDTDGFLSQSASQAMARLFDKLADIASDGNTADVSYLFSADGRPVDSYTWVDGKYGPSVRVSGGWFNPSNAADASRRLATDTRKGYVFGTVRGRVTVRMSATWLPLVELDDDAPTIVAPVSETYYR